MSFNQYDEKLNTALQRLDIWAGVAFFILLFERICEHFWPCFAWVAIWCGIWAFDVEFTYGLIPSLIFYAGFYFIGYLSRRGFSFPSKREIYRRMEQRDQIAHRPVDFLHDRPAGEIRSSIRKLWDIRKDEVIGLVRRLRLPRLRAVMTQSDPYGVSIAAVFILMTGLVFSGTGFGDRISKGLFPTLPFAEAGLDPQNVIVRIIAPEYTRKGVLTIEGVGKSDELAEIAQGSVVKVLAPHYFRASLNFGDQRVELNETEDGLSAEFTVDQVSQGRLALNGVFWEHLGFNYKVIEDHVPAMRLNGEIERGRDGRLRIPLVIKDDYGLKDLRLKIDKSDSVLDYPLGDEYEEVRSLYAGAGDIEEEVEVIYDLAAHSWSGLPVKVRISGRDHAGHEVALAPVDVVLPERVFTDALAQEIIGNRQRLAWAPVGSARVISENLFEPLKYPRRFRGDIVAYMGLKSASGRLYFTPTIKTANEVLPLLWNIALRLEDGDLSIAFQRMMDIQKDLERAMNDPNSSPEKIADLTRKLSEAMQQYMQALAQKMHNQQQAGNPEDMVSEQMLNDMVDPLGLNEFLQEMAKKAMSGDRDAAQEMMSQFRQMMEQLSSPESMKMPEDVKAMAETLKGLQELIENQQSLLDLTVQDIEQGHARYPVEVKKYTPEDQIIVGGEQDSDMPPMPMPLGNGIAPGSSGDPLRGSQGKSGSGQGEQGLAQQRSQTQGGLQGELDGLTRRFEEKSGQGAPKNFPSAGDAMGRSQHSLSQGNPRSSVPHQRRAIEELQQGMDSMQKQLSQRLQNMTVLSMGQMSEGDDGQGNPFKSQSTDITDEGQRRSVDDIIDLLRDKSGEWDRSIEERDYYRRLLERF